MSFGGFPECLKHIQRKANRNACFCCLLHVSTISQGRIHVKRLPQWVAYPLLRVEKKGGKEGKNQS